MYTQQEVDQLLELINKAGTPNTDKSDFQVAFKNLLESGISAIEEENEFSTELSFSKDGEIYYDATGESLTFTLKATGNKNGVGRILRLNKPTAVNFPANFEAHPNSATLDATKLNYYVLIYHSNWNGSGTARVIYTNSLFTAI